jgi:hypothetical protein
MSFISLARLFHPRKAAAGRGVVHCARKRGQRDEQADMNSIVAGAL